MKNFVSKAILVGAILCTASCVSGQSMETLLARMDKVSEQNLEERSDSDMLTSLSEVRRFVIDHLYTEYLSEADTLLFFEAVSIESGIFYGTVWGQESTFSYTSDKPFDVSSISVEKGKSFYSSFIIKNLLDGAFDLIEGRT